MKKVILSLSLVLLLASCGEEAKTVEAKITIEEAYPLFNVDTYDWSEYEQPNTVKSISREIDREVEKLSKAAASQPSHFPIVKSFKKMQAELLTVKNQLPSLNLNSVCLAYPMLCHDETLSREEKVAIIERGNKIQLERRENHRCKPEVLSAAAIPYMKLKELLPEIKAASSMFEDKKMYKVNPNWDERKEEIRKILLELVKEEYKILDNVESSYRAVMGRDPFNMDVNDYTKVWQVYYDGARVNKFKVSKNFEEKTKVKECTWAKSK
jgi:hypothetical protein